MSIPVCPFLSPIRTIEQQERPVATYSTNDFKKGLKSSDKSEIDDGSEANSEAK